MSQDVNDKNKNAVLKVIPIADSAELSMPESKKLLSVKTKLFAITRVSNLSGTGNPVKAIIAIALSKNSPVFIYKA